MSVTIELTAELYDALKTGSSEKRISPLWHVSNLFLHDADRLNERQIAVFDDVLVHFAERFESRALVEPSKTVAPMPSASIETVRCGMTRLPSTPVLTESVRLTDSDLVDIAKSKSHRHLLAISGRASLSEMVTAILVERGNREVARRLVDTVGASFSEWRYTSSVKNTDQDSSLVEKLALQLDIPLQPRAAKTVRSRLLASASPEKRDQIQETLTSIAKEVGREATGSRYFTVSERLVQQLNRQDMLNEKVLAGIAQWCADMQIYQRFL